VEVVFTRRAIKDAATLDRSGAGLKGKAAEILSILRENPFRDNPPYKLLRGDLSGLYSRRINRRHRIVYRVIEEEDVVEILSMWGHYE